MVIGPFNNLNFTKRPFKNINDSARSPLPSQLKLNIEIIKHVLNINYIFKYYIIIC